MFLRKQFDKHTGVYRSSDSIGNFKIRISLRTLNTLIKVPRFVHVRSDTNASTDVIETDDEIESHTIKWQEKRLSQKEINFFSEKENCQTDAQKEYHQTIKRHGLDGDNRNFDKIFTYISEDSFNPDVDDKKYTEFIQRVSDLDKESSNGDLVNQKIGGRESLFKGIFGYETMYVMADLGEEVILFTIRWRSRDGLLVVYPDFNSIDIDPYLQEIDSGRRHMFHYAMENLSEDYGEDDHINKEIQIISHLSKLSITSSTSFQIPPKRCANLLFFMEIESGEYFEYDNIHIRYTIDIPHHCELLDGLSEGSTHSSRKSTVTDQHNIGHCAEVMLLCSCDYQWNDNMKITFDVISVDGWSRQRSEGYTVVSFPLKPGIFHHKLSCYRELSKNTFLDALRRYFIGGSRIVDHKAFNGITKTETVSKLNRYGNETISTGSLSVKFQLVLQRNEGLIKTSFTKHRKSNPKNISKHQITIQDVLSAYQVAKRRLEATTSNK